MPGLRRGMVRGRLESPVTADIAHAVPRTHVRPVQLEGAGLGRDRSAAVWERSRPASRSNWTERRMARFWIRPVPIRRHGHPPSGRGPPVDPVARALTPLPYFARAFTAYPLGDVPPGCT